MVLLGPPPVSAADAAAGGPEWTATSVRFEPLGPGPAGLTVAGTGTYRGALEVRRNGRSLAVVNDVAFEDYVRGIEEVPPSWPAAALQAQAIAARTYAAYRAAARDAVPWKAVGADICATPRCQVYRGLDAERKARGHGWLAAVEATAGRVLLSGNRPILASYSSTANGPLAMSQNGALAMAQEGRSASDILHAYYGIRPTRAPGAIPPSIKVAVDMGTAGARISSATPFRVLDGTGAVLVARAVGDWKVVPGGDGVRVLPPRAFEAPDPRPGEPAATVEAETGVLRQPTRAITATAPLARPGGWAFTALALCLAAGSGAITVLKRRCA